MAMDFTRSRDRVRQLIASKKPAQQSRSTLTPDKLRDNVIDEAGRHTERFRGAMSRKPEIEYEIEREDGTKEQKSVMWDGYGDAIKDVARANYDFFDPKLRNADEVLPSRQLNRDLLREYMHTDEFDSSRPFTQGNETESVFGALAASKSLQESAQTRMAQHVGRAGEMAEQEQIRQSADDMMEELRQRAKQENAEHGTVQDDTRRGIKQAIKQGAGATRAIENLLHEQAGSSYANDVRAAGQAAAGAADEAVEAFNSLPGVEEGAATNLNADQQIELAEKWADNPELLEIMKMLGRMFPAITKAREARSKNVNVDPVNIGTGRELERLLPSELALGVIPGLKPLFMDKYQQHGLLQYDMEGRERVSKGPIIVLHDGSGSMSGTPFVWATSLCLCLLKMARREKRTYAGIEFGSRGELKGWVFPKDEDPDPDQILDYAGHFFGGGTDTGPALVEALRIIEGEPEFETADVVLIGDGEDRYDQEDQDAVKALRDLDVRITGLSILHDPNRYMEQACDWHTDVQDLAGANSATDQLAGEMT